MDIDNKDIKKYYRKIRRKLPYVPNEKKKFLTILQEGLYEFYTIHPTADLDELYQEYGTVDQICEDFKDYVNLQQLSWNPQRFIIISKIIVMITLIVLVCFIYFVWDICSHAPADLHYGIYF
jgi:uncharacterized membrane protein YukC